MKKLLSLFLVILPFSSFSQKIIEEQELIWYSYFQKIELNDKWYIESELHERHFITPLKQHQFLIRSHVHRKLGADWEVSVGGCGFFQSPNDPTSSSNLIVPEIRPHFEFAYKQKLKRVIFDHRYKTEFRFFHNTNANATALEKGFNFGNIRFRYRIQAIIPIYKKIRLKVSDEIHINVGNKIVKNVFDQNRIYAGLNYEFSPNLNVDVGYMNWFQQRPDGRFFDRDILRFTIYHTISKKQKTK